MFKKYVHPCYEWNSQVYKQLNDKQYVSVNGELITLDKLNEKVSKDSESVTKGDYKPKDGLLYGLLDCDKYEFDIKAKESIAELNKQIIDITNTIEKINYFLYQQENFNEIK